MSAAQENALIPLSSTLAPPKGEEGSFDVLGNEGSPPSSFFSATVFATFFPAGIRGRKNCWAFVGGGGERTLLEKGGRESSIAFCTLGYTL